MPRQKTRLKFGKTEFKNSIQTIYDGINIIDKAVGEALELIKIILSTLEKTRNFPLVDDLHETIAYIATYIAKIQNQASQMKTAILLIEKITEEHLNTLEDNGTEIDE